MLRVLLLIGLLLAGLGGCAPSVTPLYRDYEVRLTTEADTGRADTFARIRAALRSAGWEEAESEAPNVVATAPRLISNRGLSRTEVALDVAPIGDRFVRVFFHPYRYSVLGGRTKVAYLSSGLRRAILPELNEALEAQGFVVLGTPRERDEETVEG